MPCRGLSRRSLLLLGSLFVFLVGAGGDARPDREDDDFWEKLAHPGHDRFVAALERGKNIFRTAERARDPSKLTEAVAAFREAVAASPRDPDGHYWLGKCHYELDQMKEAIAAFGRVRRLAPTYTEDDSIAFKLGIAFSKGGAFARAVKEYDRAERLLAARNDQSRGVRASRATLHGNAAEALMALGRLDEAIQRYREALELQPGYVLAWWGLAVALDRDEQVSKAMAAVQRAVAYDRQMRRLSDTGVFFIPAGDVHYYRALGHLALGRLDRSKQDWERFIKELPDSPWAQRARDHLAQLGRRLPGRERRRRLAPAPARDGGAERKAQDSTRVQYQLRTRLSAIRGCYRKELKKRPNLTGRLTVSLVVNKSGRVTRARIRQSTLRRPSLEVCVLRLIKKTRFGASSGDGPVAVDYPIEFKPH